MPPPRQNFIENNFNVSHSTIVDWYSFVREVFVSVMEDESTKLGRPGKIVEIDEAKFSRSKYHRGRHVKGQWVFGGVEILLRSRGKKGFCNFDCTY